MEAFIIKVFEGNSLFQILVEICVAFYPTVDCNKCICFVKFEFCYLDFQKDQGTMLSKHSQNEAVLKRCKVSDADYVLNVLSKNFNLALIFLITDEPLIPQTLFPQVFNLGKSLENVALFEYCYILFLASEAL